MIFLTVVGSFTTAIVYDRQQKKRIQKKWCDLVAHQAQEMLPVNQLRRKLTVVISAPPGDSMRPSRDFFREYIKPVFNASAIDYEVIEGRKEGDVRYGVAEKIRRERRSKGEKGTGSDEEEAAAEEEAEDIVQTVRTARGILPEPGVKGDVVLGRHTWKEYIAGVHEGWLGPLTKPHKPASPDDSPPQTQPAPASATDSSESTSAPKSDDDPKQTESKDGEAKKDEAKKDEAKEDPRAAYLQTTDYESAPLSPHTPSLLEPSVAIHQQHMLGFLKTPQRIWNFLNRRKLADEIGRETAAIILAASLPYQDSETFTSTSTIEFDNVPLDTRAPENDAHVVSTSRTYEQQSTLQEEEIKWHKAAWRPNAAGETRERIWNKDIVMDPRIANRMRKFTLSDEEKGRANRIAAGLETTKAREIKDLRQEPVWMPEEDD